MNVDWSAIGSVGTAVAVLVAAWQVRKNTQHARTDFEDDLSRGTEGSSTVHSSESLSRLKWGTVIGK